MMKKLMKIGWVIRKVVELVQMCLMVDSGVGLVDLCFKGCHYRVTWDRLHNCSFAFARTKIYELGSALFQDGISILKPTASNSDKNWILRGKN